MSGLRRKTSVLAKRCLEDPQQFFVVSEVMSSAKFLEHADHCPGVLMAAFYAQYTPGCTNFYSLLEYFFVGNKLPKWSKLQFSCN